MPDIERRYDQIVSSSGIDTQPSASRASTDENERASESPPFSRRNGMPVQKAKNFKGTLARLTGYLAPHRTALVVVIVAGVFGTMFSVAGPKILGQYAGERQCPNAVTAPAKKITTRDRPDTSRIGSPL